MGIIQKNPRNYKVNLSLGGRRSVIERATAPSVGILYKQILHGPSIIF